MHVESYDDNGVLMPACRTPADLLRRKERDLLAEADELERVADTLETTAAAQRDRAGELRDLAETYRLAAIDLDGLNDVRAIAGKVNVPADAPDPSWWGPFSFDGWPRLDVHYGAGWDGGWGLE